MKLSSKPMSSPGRTEKYPPPLMRFLRSNVGSKSRGRSRASPMFVRKKNTAIETQEPSSPKVTCIGQVRVRRSKKSGNKTRVPVGRRRRCRCRWISSTLSCRNLRIKLKPKSIRTFFRKLVSFFQVGCRRKSESCNFESKFQEKKENPDICRNYEQHEVDTEEEEEEDDENLIYPSSTPPKNALLLTRCRSAPYRSSSLASRFWGSPLITEEDDEEAQKTELENREEQLQLQHVEIDDPTSESEPKCRDSAPESRTDPDSEANVGHCSKDFEGSVVNVDERKSESGKSLGLKTGEDCSVQPMILTRCKSEPASKSSEKIYPETIL